jgi:hypothetical protein
MAKCQEGAAAVWPTRENAKFEIILCCVPFGNWRWPKYGSISDIPLSPEAFIGRRLKRMTTTTMTGSQATEALLHSPIPALRKLQVEVSDGGVVLSGSVSSYYLKQLAQETVLPFLERRDLVNRITVTR